MVDEEKGILVDNKTRTVRIMDDKILFTLKRDGITDYYSNHPELAKILVMDCIHPYRHEGRLKVRVADNNGEQLNCYSYLIALGCYMGRVKADTFMSDTIRLKTECMSNSITVDHVDSVVENNTVYNLSFMSAKENNCKGAIVSRFKLPVKLTVAYVQGKYRIGISNPMTTLCVAVEDQLQSCFNGTLTGHDTIEVRMFFLCNTAVELYECLRWLSQNIVEGTEPIRDNDGTWLRKEQQAYFMDAQTSMRAQTNIAMMDESVFQPFMIQQKKEALIF